MGSHWRVFSYRVELMFEVSSRPMILGLSTRLLDLSKPHQRDSIFRCYPEKRVQRRDPRNLLPICILSRLGMWGWIVYAGWIRCFKPWPPGWKSAWTRLRVTLSSPLLDSPGGFQRNLRSCYRSKIPHQVRGGKDSQNFNDFLTTSLRADFLSLTFVVALSTPGVQRHLAAAGAHLEGSNIWWLYSNDNHLWSATRGRRFTTFFHSNTSTSLWTEAEQVSSLYRWGNGNLGKVGTLFTSCC